MTSKNKQKIARQNGAKAAGSKSPEGLANSSRNALRHGLTSKSLVLTNESQPRFDDLLQSYIDRFQPHDGVEMGLIEQMVACQWRLRRLWSMQTAALDHKMDLQEPQLSVDFHTLDEPTRASIAFTTLGNEEKSLQLFLRYETSYERMYNRTLKTLERLQQTRKESTTSNPPEPPEQKLRNDPKIPDIAPEITPEIQPKPAPKPENIGELPPPNTTTPVIPRL
jgi:hypothetical protein